MKIIKVKSCSKCPIRDRGVWGSMDYCEQVKKHIMDSKHILDNSGFPFWCPLEDYKE